MRFFNYNAVKSWIENGNIYVQLDNGKEAFLPIHHFRLLAKATTEQLQNIEIIDGYALHWPDLDEDLSVAGFFEKKTDAISLEIANASTS
jgi:Protein of unknown function (DUF2442)